MSFISAQMARSLITRPETEEAGEMVVTMRPSSTAVLAVDSADRYSSTAASRVGGISPYQFTISRNQALLNGFFTRIALTEVVFPWYVPNINVKTATIDYSHTLVPNGSITLATAFYTPTELAAALQTALVADGAVGTTAQYIDGRFVIGAGAGQTIAFFPTSIPGQITTSDFQLFDLLGLTTANSAAALTQTSRVTRCRYTEYIDIVSSQLTYNQELKDGNTDPIVRDVLARIYLECENDQPIGVKTLLTPATTTDTQNTIPGTYPFTIYRQFSTPKQILWNKTQSIGNLTFEVYDDKGNLLTSNLQGGGLSSIYPDWRMTLLVSEN